MNRTTYFFRKCLRVYVLGCAALLCALSARAQVQMEYLNRGVVAVRNGDAVYVGWRLLGTDSADVAFNVYRNGTKLNPEPITQSTNFVDLEGVVVATGESAPLHYADGVTYTVRAVVAGVEQEASAPTPVWEQPYLDIPLQVPPDDTIHVRPDSIVSYSYTANDASVGDLDGDGDYEIVLKWDPTNAKDNSQGGHTGNVLLDAYELDGTHLWRIDLGPNIRAGAHYTQFMVYDLDSDGKAEVACKTADGTRDAQGNVIGDPNAYHRNAWGWILEGPEFLTVFNGETGAILDTEPYVPSRHPTIENPTPAEIKEIWGDDYGNRIDRFIGAVAYLDGQHPSLIMGRGYYTRLVRAAWDFSHGDLTLRWVFDSFDEGNEAYAGQGNHQMSVADVDGDGRQEIFNGSSAIDDDGTGLWANGLGHGDALHVSDMDPDRPGLELWMPHESPAYNGNIGAAFIDALTGTPLWTVTEARADVGRGMASDIDPRYKGYECWASRGGLYASDGTWITDTKPSMNFGIWWDGDLQRELLDRTVIDKWDTTTNTTQRLFTVYTYGVESNNGTKSNPALSADLMGDWREEVMYRTTDNAHLRIFTTTIPTDQRIYTLMHDPQYRVAVAWQNSAYNQPPHPGFYLGGGMAPPPRPDITVVKGSPTGARSFVPLPVKIYPNPSVGAFYVQYESPFQYQLLDATGRTLLSGASQGNCTVGSHLSPGLYLLRITSTQGIRTFKLLRE
ncbi:rhamnogalacturonan endolyase [Catalinimonas alkaloidigena]|uniref:Rhamnogalacturonan endolyase n=1 Tax=Catalinimonas alkaloidigena TaxID=1075417 RepID=A0A1G9RMR5_9BACT|nr:T9SS type A sorting domain-containing protein [Catalinimonas alkaloidigena]SDM24558.1 rhamnogalacturonan endolyase [Catalinimonas alkaloidigena]